MINMNLSALVAALDEEARDCLEGAAVIAMNRGLYEIGIEDYFEKMLDTKTFLDICVQFDVNVDILKQQFDKGRKVSNKNSGRPVFSTLLIEFLQEAYLLGTLEMKSSVVTVPILVISLLLNPARYSIMPFFKELSRISPEKLSALLEGLNDKNLGQVKNSNGTNSANGAESALSKYATDFTEEAKQGKIDPVFSRGEEIRQAIDILTRRRKNNPILVGDPGVGKTAVAEGLAYKIAHGDVPDSLLNVRFVGLDMGRLQAGASVKGEFEKRLKLVIDEIKSSPVPIILFIDEAHTLVGSGNAAGTSDGANLLKPALARGELRTMAATTWSEYKKYFEKDAALARRFQLIKLDEPSTEQTVTILRGLRPNYEKSHKVYVRDEAITLMADLSARYISGRYLPDKAIDVLDTACARVKVSMGAKPNELEKLEEEFNRLSMEKEAIERDNLMSLTCGTSDEKLLEISVRLTKLQSNIDTLKARWQKEKDLVEAIIKLRTDEKLINIENEQENCKKQIEIQEQSLKVSNCDKQKQLIQLQKDLKDIQKDSPLVFYEVDSNLVSSLISEWTGIPVEKLTRQAEIVSNLGSRLRHRIRGQNLAIETIEKAVLTVFSGLENPDTPNGIFLLVGPSGVGKTETALAVADELFGGERFLISVNMTEFQEKHTVSRLIGSPPGYVGYGEGGRLTEAVRRQPYSAVLFDEVEKAHPDILNLFYQMFDKGVLADGEGRDIDFRNTMVFMTSNLGSEIVSALCENGENCDHETLLAALKPVLLQHFKPALLGRLTVVPFFPMNPAVLKELVNIKLELLAKRLKNNNKLNLTWNEEAVDSIVAGCTAVDSGARNIDHIMNASLLPNLAIYMLGQVGSKVTTINIGIDKEKGLFTFNGC